MAGPQKPPLPAVELAALLENLAGSQTALVDVYRAQIEDAEATIAELTLQVERSRTALERIPQGVCFFNGDQRLVLANKRFAELTGVSPDDARPGMHFTEVIRRRYASGSPPTITMEEFLRQRIAVATTPHPVVSTIELTDGRMLKIVHEPMPDGGWVATFEDITEHVRSDERVRHLAMHDALTDLLNRFGFVEALTQCGTAARARGEDLALLILDIDHFKAVNDTLGHAVGDLLLKESSDRIRSCLSENDIMGRIGSDEFAILLPMPLNSGNANRVAEAIVSAFARPFYLVGHEVVVAVSISIARLRDLGTEADLTRLLQNAEVALRIASQEPENAIRVFEPEMEQRRSATLRLEQDMRHALASEDFTVHFQPKVDARSHSMIGIEALVRWNHREKGLLTPASFIPVAEKCGLILDLGIFVLRKACALAAGWADLTLAVNLSPVQLLQNGLAEQIIQIMRDADFDPARLELEITEGVLMQKTPLTMATLARLRSEGVKIAIDDFGTGYSSLSYLQNYPADRLKIDRSFIRDAVTMPQARAIIEATITMGHALGLSVTAEGVETRAQAELLKAHGCDELQGYLFGRPMPASELEALMADGRIRPRAKGQRAGRH